MSSHHSTGKGSNAIPFLQNWAYREKSMPPTPSLSSKFHLGSFWLLLIPVFVNQVWLGRSSKASLSSFLAWAFSCGWGISTNPFLLSSDLLSPAAAPSRELYFRFLQQSDELKTPMTMVARVSPLSKYQTRSQRDWDKFLVSQYWRGLSDWSIGKIWNSSFHAFLQRRMFQVHYISYVCFAADRP